MTLTADQICRRGNSYLSYKAEMAVGNNLCRTQNVSGAILAAASAIEADSSYPASNVISGNDAHINPTLDQDNNWWKGYGNESVAVFNSSVNAGVTGSFSPLLAVGAVPKFTVRGWVYLTSTSSSPEVIAQLLGATSGKIFQFGVTNGKIYLKLFVSGGGTTLTITSTSTLSTNTWYFVEASFDSSLGSSNIKLFINGVLDNSGGPPAFSLTSENSELEIGDFGGNCFTGYLSEFEYSGSVIRNTAGYTAPLFITPDLNTTICYKLNDANGSSTAADSSGNGLNAGWLSSPVLGTTFRGMIASGAINVLTINLGRSITANEIWIFLHPFLTTCSKFAVQVSSNGSSYTNVATIVSANQLKLQQIVFASTSFQYVQFIPQNTGTDGLVRVVQLKVYNWMDETVNIQVDSSSKTPKIQITAKIDPTQNASPTPSELQITFNNIEGRYSNMNASSPLYGAVQIDGAGSGIRSNMPVRLTATGQADTGDTFSKFCFYGFVSCDDQDAGSTGITYDDVSGTVTFICKSLYDLLAQTISPPVYPGSFFYQIIQDVCWRSGIPQQFLNISPVLQMAPFASFGTDNGQDIISQLLQVMPFARCYETFDPLPTLNFINYGRSRMQTDLSLYLSNVYAYSMSGSLMYILGNLTVNGLNVVLFDLWVWDTTKPLDQGISQLLNQASTTLTNSGVSSALASTFCNSFIVNGYMIAQWNNGNTPHLLNQYIIINLTTLAFDIVNIPTVSTITSGIPTSITNSLPYSVVAAARFLFWSELHTSNNSNHSYNSSTDFTELVGFDGSAQSIVNIPVSISVSGGVATVTHTNHPYASGYWIGINNATDSGGSLGDMNGFHGPITKTGANTYTFPTTATGTISNAIENLVATVGPVNIHSFGTAVPAWFGGDATYLCIAPTAPTATSMLVWQHNGVLSTTYSPTTLSGLAGYSFTSANTFYDPTTQNLFFIAPKLVDDGFLHCFKINIPTAFATPSTAPTDLGAIIPNSTESVINQIFSDGTYLFYTLSDGTRYVFNLTTLATPFFLGSGNKLTISQGAANAPGPLFGYWTKMSYSLPGGTPVTLYLFAPLKSPFVYGYCITSTTPFNPSPSVSFDLTAFVKNMQISDGNPDGNRVVVNATPNTVATISSALWTQPSNYTLSFPTGQLVKIAIPINDSVRGFLGKTDTRRFFNSLVFGSNVIDSPGTVTSVIVGTTVVTTNVSVSISVSGGVATVTHTNHGFSSGYYVNIAGATSSGAIGDMNSFHGPITSTGANTYTFPTTATGTISNAVESLVASVVNTYPMMFWAEDDVAYLQVDLTSPTAVPFVLNFSSVQGYALSSSSEANLQQDVSNQISQELYGRTFTIDETSALYVDPSFYNDLLLNGSFKKLYLQKMDLPRYPIIQLSELVAISNANKGLVNALFEVTEYNITGYAITVKGKQYYTIFNI